VPGDDLSQLVQFDGIGFSYHVVSCCPNYKESSVNFNRKFQFSGNWAWIQPESMCFSPERSGKIEFFIQKYGFMAGYNAETIDNKGFCFWQAYCILYDTHEEC
jgi:hypothetical protein